MNHWILDSNVETERRSNKLLVRFQSSLPTKWNIDHKLNAITLNQFWCGIRYGGWKLHFRRFTVFPLRWKIQSAKRVELDGRRNWNDIHKWIMGQPLGIIWLLNAVAEGLTSIFHPFISLHHRVFLVWLVHWGKLLNAVNNWAVL